MPELKLTLQLGFNQFMHMVYININDIIAF